MNEPTERGRCIGHTVRLLHLHAQLALRQCLASVHTALKKLALQHPHVRAACVLILEDQLHRVQLGFSSCHSSNVHVRTHRQAKVLRDLVRQRDVEVDAGSNGRLGDLEENRVLRNDEQLRLVCRFIVFIIVLDCSMFFDCFLLLWTFVFGCLGCCYRR